MAEQEQAKRASKDAARQDEVKPAVSESGVASEIDDLLTEIDEVLEENAEEFVKNYVQKGGE